MINLFSIILLLKLNKLNNFNNLENFETTYCTLKAVKKNDFVLTFNIYSKRCFSRDTVKNNATCNP